jgi:hypothetical protein
MSQILLILLGLSVLLTELPPLFFGPGWITRKTIIPEAAITFFLVMVFCYFSGRVHVEKKWLKIILSVSGILSLVSVLVYYLEYTHFDNFVFSRYHFIPWYFAVWASGLAGFAAVLAFPRLRGRWLLSLAAFYVVTFCISNGTLVIGESLARIPKAVASRSLNSEARLSDVYGQDYAYVRFLKQHIPADKRVLIPPNILPWRHTGDFYLMQAFLYPRKIVTASQDWLFKDGNFSDFDYVLISSEDDSDGRVPYRIWPDVPVPAAQIVIYDFDGTPPRTVAGTDFRPQDWTGIKAWGYLIPRKI